MSADVLYLAAVKAAADGDTETARRVLMLARDPEALAAAVAPPTPNGGGRPAPADTFR